MATKNEKADSSKWKSILWKKDSEIEWEQYTDEQLLRYVEDTKYDAFEADGYIVKKANGVEVKEPVRKLVKLTEGFQAYHQTPFDYQQLTYELGRRGYVQGWYKKVPQSDQDSSPTVEVDGKDKGITQYVMRAIEREGDIRYAKLPLYSETEELIESTFGKLKKGVKGMVIAQVLDDLLRGRFGNED